MDDGTLFSLAGLVSVFGLGMMCGLVSRVISHSVKGGESQ